MFGRSAVRFFVATAKILKSFSFLAREQTLNFLPISFIVYAVASHYYNSENFTSFSSLIEDACS